MVDKGLQQEWVGWRVMSAPIFLPPMLLLKHVVDFGNLCFASGIRYIIREHEASALVPTTRTFVRPHIHSPTVGYARVKLAPYAVLRYILFLFEAHEWAKIVPDITLR